NVCPCRIPAPRCRKNDLAFELSTFYSPHMLPPAVVDTARRAVRVAMDERRESLAREIADIYGYATTAGALHSGRLLVAVKDRLASEYKIRAMTTWEIWARALATQATVPTADLRETLVGEVERALDAESPDLLHHYHEAKRIA